MKRYCLALLLVVLVLPAQAAELGSILFRSFLDQPLDIKMELRLARGESLPQMQCEVASPDQFTALGYSKSAFSADIQCKLVSVGKGKSPQLWLSTQQAVNESLFNLVLAIKSAPNAETQLKEFTVVLEAQPATILPSVKKYDQLKPISETKAIEAKQEETTSATFEVKADQTLLGVARQLGVSELEFNQFMLAVLQRNPHAFIDGNINRMKKGSLLSLPSEMEWQALNKGEAMREVQAQYQRGASVSSLAPNSDAMQSEADTLGPSSPSDQTIPASEGRDVVRLTKATGKSVKMTPQEEMNALRDELTAHEMSIQEANKKTAALENQIAEMQKLLVLKQSLTQQKNQHETWLKQLAHQLMQNPWWFLALVLACVFALLSLIQIMISQRVKKALQQTSAEQAVIMPNQVTPSAENINSTLHKTEQILKDINLDLDQSGQAETSLSKPSDMSMQFDLVSSYLDLGDSLGASKVLQQIIQHGDDEQQARAREMLSQIR